MKLKLLFVASAFSNGGGAENVLTTLVNNLDSEKYDITILECVGFNVKKEPIKDNIKLLNAVIKEKQPYATELKNLFCYFPKIMKQILNLLTYDVVITWNDQLPSFILPAFTAEKKIAWFHGEITGMQPGTEQYSLQKKVWALADKIVTISNQSLQSLELRFPQFMHKASIIYNSTDAKKIIAISSVNITYEINFKDNSLPLLCIVGRLDPNKNQALLLHTLSYLIKDNFKCNLLLIGDGGNRNDFEKIVQDLDLNDYVLFAGFQSNPYPLMKKADLICLTSFSEGWGMVLCEGMVMGKPFVTTPVAGASEELANDGKCGLVADYEPKEYAKCIKSILTDKNKYMEMSKSCKEHIKEYTVEASVESFNNLIDSLNIETVHNKSEKPSPYLLVKFANAFVFSRIYRIKVARNIFFTEKNIHNFCRVCYYIMREFVTIFFYPFFFIKGFSIALKLRKEHVS